MKQPSREHRSALQALWLNGQGPIVSYLWQARQEAIQTVLDTEGKIRDEAAGEVKAIDSLARIISGTDEARPIERHPDVT